MSIVNLDHFGGSYYRTGGYVLVGGCFDPLHEGHIQHFVEARRHGPLVCAIAPDAEIARKRTVCLPEMTRLQVLNACGLIEHVHLAVHGIVPVLEELRPLSYVKGGDWRGRMPAAEVEACGRLGIPILFTDVPEQSSTRLLADYQRRLNAEKLAAFDVFMQQQVENTAPWAPVTPYDFESRSAIESPQADLIADVFRGCSVLDYGCGFGHLVRLLTERGMSARGWDPQDGTDGSALSDTYDLVICREVLEHVALRRFQCTVRHAASKAKRFLYVTTRFATGSHALDIEGKDGLDPTHCTMLNQDYLRSLIVLSGLTRRADLEAQLDWRKLNRVLVYEVPHGAVSR